MANIKGIEVQGEVYDLEDTVAQNTASEAKTAVESAVDDISTLEERVSDNSDSIESVSDKVDAITSIFNFLDLLQGDPASQNCLGYADPESAFTFNVPNPEKYRGYAFVVGSSSYNPSVPGSFGKARDLLFCMKAYNGDTRMIVRTYLGGAREIECYQTAIISNSGQATINPGYCPKADSDSESDTSQAIFGVYAVYGIL